jgi:DNA invertase Pin-like site-specific DNA recombinase
LAESHGYTALVADVKAGRVGTVLVADLSRLGLLASEMDSFTRICAKTDTLIITESEIFDPKIIGDRMFISFTTLRKDSEILWRRR